MFSLTLLYAVSVRQTEVCLNTVSMSYTSVDVYGTGTEAYAISLSFCTWIAFALIATPAVVYLHACYIQNNTF